MSSRTREQSNFSRHRGPNRRLRRRLGLVCLLGGLVVASAGPSLAQSGSGKKDGKPIMLTADDGWPIAITYYESTRSESKETPVVVLLHGEKGNRLVWTGKGGLAEDLQSRGYAVIAVDLRKHGESKRGAASRGGSDLRAPDYLLMVTRDLEAVKDFIYQEHQKKKLNMRKTAIVASDVTAPVAVAFTLADWAKKPHPDGPTRATSTPRGQDVRALVLLSPEENVPGINAGRALLALRNPVWGISFLVMFGEQDVVDRGGRTAKGVHKKLELPQNKDRVYLQPFPYKLRGTNLLGKGIKAEAYIVAFLDKHLNGLTGPGNAWRDRQSRLTR